MSDWSVTVYMQKILSYNINYQTIIDNEMYNIDQKLTVLIFVKLFNRFLNTLPFQSITQKQIIIGQMYIPTVPDDL